jgi:hypothetical protein
MQGSEGIGVSSQRQAQATPGLDGIQQLLLQGLQTAVSLGL